MSKKKKKKKKKKTFRLHDLDHADTKSKFSVYIVKTTAEDFTAGTKHTWRHSILEKNTLQLKYNQ